MTQILKDTTSKCYPEDFVGNVICGDALEVMRSIPDGTIDAIVTDPPYGLNKESIRNDVNLDVFYKVLPELHRVAKDNSWFISFFSTKYLPKIFCNNPFEYFWQVVLYCPEASVLSPIGTTRYMSVMVFKKGKPKINERIEDIIKDTPGRQIEPDEGYIDHPTPKPKHFIMHLLRAFSKKDDVVLDPFSGSGSILLAARLLERRFIGIEIEKKFCEMACRRLISYNADRRVTSVSL
ncbi:hypothetical protein COV61_03240 [Candidatus Micrarchaeota archaeon CG11_big_fil_rev_8_21_14_0_20_47_5]|nr:MAG: hypothetical protein COV61_03240 [Candidatus Micrarchaeota archaeon CG11_big_fil_rev_8_21_14_0_20_47_5]